MNLAEMQQQLRDGRVLFGTMATSASPGFVTALSLAGADFAFIDTEHIPLDRMLVSWMCRAYAGAGMPPMVRIPTAEVTAAFQAIDGGAQLVIASYVEQVEEVRALCGAVKYRPLKGEILRELTEGRRSPDAAMASHLESYNGALALINIESVPALDRLDALLDVEGLDGVFLGPHDLSCSLGLPEQFDHPEFLRAAEKLFRAARERGLIAGGHFIGVGPAEQARQWIDMGANLLVIHADVVYTAEGLERDLRTLRGSLAQPHSGSGKGIIV